jgi:hypothetical protein
MNRSNYRSPLTTIQKFTVGALVTLLLSGGACYEKPITIPSTGIKASDMLPNYWLRQSIDRCELAFDRPRFNLQSSSNKRINLIPPAKFTFQGKALLNNKSTTNENKLDDDIFILPCENGTAEFVVTDDRGGERRDKVDLSKIKLQLPQTPVDRSKDLQIPIRGAAYPQHMEIQTRMTGSASTDNYDDMLMNTEEYQGDRTRITFDAKSQVLTIPARILKRIKSKQPTIQLEVKISLLYQYPTKESSPWLQYEYWTPSATIRLK